MHISVCVSTYQRPALLANLLDKLAIQDTANLFTYSVVVADNDAGESARTVVKTAMSHFSVPLKYCVEPRRSISHVRNMTVAQSQGELIAFIDDDEFPGTDWLLNHYQTVMARGCAGTLGPVLPSYTEGTPDWVKRGGFFDRPDHETGYIMPWQECRTGNVLLKREVLPNAAPFAVEFGTGGSDVDLFRRMIEAGREFVWCQQAPVFEFVPPNRWKRAVLLKRALLRGRNSLRHPRGRAVALTKAALALPLYAVALPFLQICGHHLFMRYLIKLCDHTGRLAGAFGIELVKERHM